MLPTPSKTNIAFILLMLIASIGNAQKNIDRIIAVVGEKIVLYSDIESQRFQAMQQGLNLGSVEKMRCFILDQLIYQKLLIHQAELDSLEVSDAQINAELEGRLKYFENMIGGKKELEKYYGKSYPEIKDEFYDIIKEKLLAQQMEKKITSGIRVTPAEVRAFFNAIPKDSLPYVNSQVELAHITIIPTYSTEEDIKAKTKLEKIRSEIMSGKSTFCFEALDNSDDPGSRTKCGEYDYVPRGTMVPELETWAFKLKPGEYSEVFKTSYGWHFMQLLDRKGEEYKFRHILLSPKITKEQMQKASERLDSIYNDIKSGKITFEDAARIYSNDKETKNNGGKLFNMQTGDVKFDVSTLDASLFISIDKLNAGEISRPMSYETPDKKQGYRIIKLIKRTDPHMANLYDDYQSIMNAAQNQKEAKETQDWVNRRISTTYIWIHEDFRNCEFEYKWVKVP